MTKQENKKKLEKNSHIIEIFRVDRLIAEFKKKSTYKKAKSVKKIADVTLGSKDVMEIINELGFRGEAILKYSNGKQYVIFKNLSGKGKIITGTRYLSDNPKVVNLGIGELGYARTISKGCKLMIIFDIAINVAEFLLTDEQSLSKLIGKTTTDIVKTVVSGVVAYTAAAAVATVIPIAFVPVVAAVAVGFLVGTGLDYLDKRFEVTDKLVNFLDKIGDSIGHFLEESYEYAKSNVTELKNYLNDITHVAFQEIKEFVMKYHEYFDNHYSNFNFVISQFSEINSSCKNPRFKC